VVAQVHPAGDAGPLTLLPISEPYGSQPSISLPSPGSRKTIRLPVLPNDIPPPFGLGVLYIII